MEETALVDINRGKMSTMLPQNPRPPGRKEQVGAVKPPPLRQSPNQSEWRRVDKLEEQIRLLHQSTEFILGRTKNLILY